MFKSGRAALYCSERNRSTAPLGKLGRHSPSPGIQIGARSKQMVHPIPAQHAWHSLSWLMELISLMSLEQYASTGRHERRICTSHCNLFFFSHARKTLAVLPELYTMEYSMLAVFQYSFLQY